MSVRTVMLLAVVVTHQLNAQDNSENELQYVVALIKDAFYCYGTLISPNFVVTAGNCTAATSVQYGDLSIPWYLTTSKEKILFAKRPRSNKFLEPDLGMVFIKGVQVKLYGKLSAVDYKAMTGYVIEYTSFLVPQEEILKEGLVVSCTVEKESVFAAHICVAPKGAEKQQLSLPGEPGGPLFFDGKLAGVHVGGSTLQSYTYQGDTKPYFLRTYVPISPFLS